MRYLGLALYAEGQTDYHFLLPLLQKLCEDICVSEANCTVEVSPVLGLDDSDDLKNAAREVRITDAARSALGAWNILFVHADGGNDPRRAYGERVQPALDRIGLEFAGPHVAVAAIPVREMEAWVAADGDAFRDVLGITHSNAELGLPLTPPDAEGLPDPKATLDGAFENLNPRRKKRLRGISPFLSALGEKVNLDALRRLSAFKRLEDDLRGALRDLHIID